MCDYTKNYKYNIHRAAATTAYLLMLLKATWLRQPMSTSDVVN